MTSRARVIRLQGWSSGLSIPPRTTWDVIKSAGMGWYNAFVDNEGAGNRFSQRVKTGLIRERILKQTDWNYLSIYALQHDLENPHLHKFDVAEFLEVVKPALTNFHDVMGNIKNQDLDEVLTTTAKQKKNIASNKSTDMQQPRPLQERNLEVDVTKLALGKWNRQATIDPESLSAQLRGMVTPEYFALLEFMALSGFNSRSSKYQDGSSQVQHVALLSARTWEYTETEDDKLENDGNNSNNDNEETVVVKVNAKAAEPSAASAIDAAQADSTDSTSPTINTSKDATIARVAAQLEVVYEHTMSFIPLRRGLILSNQNMVAPSDDDKITTLSEGEANEEESPKDDDDAEEEEGEVVTKTSTLVGVFEGWLHQEDPSSGNENIQWRLCLNRRALEFHKSS